MPEVLKALASHPAHQGILLLSFLKQSFELLLPLWSRQNQSRGKVLPLRASEALQRSSLDTNSRLLPFTPQGLQPRECNHLKTTDSFKCLKLLPFFFFFFKSQGDILVDKGTYC